MQLATDAEGNAELLAVIGLGSSSSGITITAGGQIDLINQPPGLLLVTNFAFSMPRDGILTSISAYFSVLSAFVLSPLTIHAQLYSSPTPNDLFSPIATAIVSMPVPIGPPPPMVGDRFNGITTGLSIPITAQTRLLMVFYITTSTASVQPTTLQGYASAGINIV